LHFQGSVSRVSQTADAQIRHAVTIDIVAAEMTQLGLSGQVQTGRRAHELRLTLQVATPSRIMSQQEARELPKLCSFPAQLQIDGGLRKSARTPQIAFQLYCSGVIQVQVSSDTPSFET